MDASRAGLSNPGNWTTWCTSNVARSAASDDGDSSQTNADRVTCSMAGDYNDGAAGRLELLCALLRGDDVAPPPPSARPALWQLAQEHRVGELCLWTLREHGADR